MRFPKPPREVEDVIIVNHGMGEHLTEMYKLRDGVTLYDAKKRLDRVLRNIGEPNPHSRNCLLYVCSLGKSAQGKGNLTEYYGLKDGVTLLDAKKRLERSLRRMGDVVTSSYLWYDVDVSTEELVQALFPAAQIRQDA